MLSVLTFALLACAAVLGVVLSSDNFLGVLAFGIGAFILFPLSVILALLGGGLSALGGVLPVAGEYGTMLGAYVDGGYGIPGFYYLIGSTVLWFTTIFQYGDEDAGTDKTSPKADDTTDTADVDSDDNETRDRTESSEIVPEGTDFTEVVGLGTEPTQKSQSQSNDTKREYDTNQVQAEPLTSLSGVGGEQAETLREAGYSTLDDVAGESQSELGNVVGNALAARIKADVDGLEVGSTGSETGTTVDTSGESETVSEINEHETKSRATGEGSDQSDNESTTTKTEDTKSSRTKNTDGVDSGDNETRDLTGFSGIVPGGADLTEVDGLGNIATEGGESSDINSGSDDQEKSEQPSEPERDAADSQSFVRSVDEIDDTAQHSTPVVVQIREHLTEDGRRHVFRAVTVDGESVQLDVWNRHVDAFDWEPGAWYEFESVRGQYWTVNGESGVTVSTTPGVTVTRRDSTPESDVTTG